MPFLKMLPMPYLCSINFHTMRHPFVFLLFAMAATNSTFAQPNRLYPESPRQESAANGQAWHGWADAFRWLEDTENPTTLRWVEAQRKYPEPIWINYCCGPLFRLFFSRFTEWNAWAFRLKKKVGFFKAGNPKQPCSRSCLQAQKAAINQIHS